MTDDGCAEEPIRAPAGHWHRHQRQDRDHCSAGLRGPIAGVDVAACKPGAETGIT